MVIPPAFHLHIVAYRSEYSFLVKRLVRIRTVWWAVQDLNLWPPPCKGGAQPTELTARCTVACFYP